MNDAAKGADGALSYQAAKPYIERYRKILAQGEHEYPKDTARKGGPKGPIHQTKARNLLDRLRDYEDAALRFFNQ